jgi:ArsR family transcriptional regulator
MNDLITLFDALSDPSRLRIVNLLLTAGELCVCEIESTLGFTQTKVSRHMRYLKERGLVRARKVGRWVFYSLPPAASTRRGTILAELKSILATMELPSADRSRLPTSIRASRSRKSGTDRNTDGPHFKKRKGIQV